jgi:hypothetical protein
MVRLHSNAWANITMNRQAFVSERLGQFVSRLAEGRKAGMTPRVTVGALPDA